MTAVLGSKPPTKKLEITDFGDRIGLRAGKLLIVNDEAHHTHDEESEWNKVIRHLHGETPITAQLDFSATPRFQKGAIFPWTISDYPLKQAILDNIVKRPMKGIAKITEAKSEHASVKYRGYLAAGVGRRREYRDQLKPLKKKPIYFVLPSELPRMLVSPALDDNLFIRVKLDGVASLSVHVAEETVFPSTEWKIRHWRGNTDIDADIACWRFVPESACRRPTRCE